MKKWTAFIIGVVFVAIFIITMFVLPPLLNWTRPTILNWQDFVDSISTVEGFVIGIITEVIPIICVTIGAIFLIIFVIKLIQGKD
ncbi:MAG: hypothetical protein KGD65_14270 [Candidatus Lokiarchaeota archaeon]|nr:hypothetical protein [Candidatus Lokiarchaeota archaeon]